MIDTREELIRALQEASELEHGLMIQYLFGAFSLKRRASEGLSEGQASLARDWTAQILAVAQEEMGHLATVCNLLSAIGAPPHFSRPNFPQRTPYYPFEFDLLPFGDEFLFRTQVFELPRNAPAPPRRMCGAAARTAHTAAFVGAPLPVDVVPDPLVFSGVGDLYQQIDEGFHKVPERDLFIGPIKSQEGSEWSITMDVRRVFDRASTSAALRDIIEDGEGTQISSPSSHYSRFTKLRADYVANSCFAAARNVVSNPATQVRRDAQPGANMIRNADSAAVCDLFNGVYYWVLTLLLQYFSRAGENDAQRTELKNAAARAMSVAIRPIAEVLTEMPFDSPDDPRRAGPSFELPGLVFLPPEPDARWTMSFERLDAIISECSRLAAVAPRLQRVGETLRYMRRALAQAARED